MFSKLFCISAPCELPHINHGQYLLGYRAGLTIGNGSSVTFQCDSEYKRSTTAPVECVLGELRPRAPACKKGKHLLLWFYLKSLWNDCLYIWFDIKCFWVSIKIILTMLH